MERREGRGGREEKERREGRGGREEKERREEKEKETESLGGRKGRCVEQKKGGEGEREEGEGNTTTKTQIELVNVPFPLQVAPKTRCSWHKVQQCAHCLHTFPGICETMHSSMLINSYSKYTLTVNSKVHVCIQSLQTFGASIDCSV